MRSNTKSSSDSSFDGIGTAADVAKLRRIFRNHVAALVLSAAVTALLLLCITNISSAYAFAACAVVGCSAILFPSVTAISVGRSAMLPRREGFEFLATALGISLVQTIFIVPVIVCLVAPQLNLTELLFPGI